MSTGPEKIRLSKSQLGNFRQMQADLERENQSYKRSQSKLMESTENVMRANTALEEAIRDRAKYLDELTSKMRLVPQKYSGWLKRRRRARDRLNKYKKHIQKKTGRIDKGKVTEEIDKVTEELQNATDSAEELKKKRETGETTMLQIRKLDTFKQDLVEMNEKLREEAQNYLKLVDLGKLNVTENMKSMCEELQNKIEQAEKIKRELENQNTEESKKEFDCAFYDQVDDKLKSCETHFNELEKLLGIEASQPPAPLTSGRLSELLNFSEDAERMASTRLSALLIKKPEKNERKIVVPTIEKQKYAKTTPRGSVSRSAKETPVSESVSPSSISMSGISRIHRLKSVPPLRISELLDSDLTNKSESMPTSAVSNETETETETERSVTPKQKKHTRHDGESSHAVSKRRKLKAGNASKKRRRKSARTKDEAKKQTTSQYFSDVPKGWRSGKCTPNEISAALKQNFGVESTMQRSASMINIKPTKILPPRMEVKKDSDDEEVVEDIIIDSSDEPKNEFTAPEIHIGSDGEVITFNVNVDKIGFASDDEDIAKCNAEIENIMGRLRRGVIDDSENLKSEPETPRSPPVHKSLSRKHTPKNTPTKSRAVQLPSTSSEKPKKHKRHKSKKQLDICESRAMPLDNGSLVYPTEATGNIFISRETLEHQEKAPNPVSKTQWANSLLQGAISNQLNRTRLQVAIAEAQFKLSQINDEIVTLEDDLMLAKFEKRAKQKRFGYALRVVSLYIPPSACTQTPYRRKSLSLQTFLTAGKLSSMQDEINYNNEFLAKQFSVEQEKMIADTQLPMLEMALQEHLRKNDRLCSSLDDMERRLSVVGDDTKVRLKEKRQRIRYENALITSQQKSGDLDARIKAQYEEIDNLKQRIDEQREFHRTLKDQIDRERKSPVPNVPQLRKTLEGYKAVTQMNQEKEAMLLVTDQNYDTQINSYDLKIKQSEAISKSNNEMRSKVRAMKTAAGVHAITSETELRDLSYAASDVMLDYERLKSKEKLLRSKIQDLTTQLIKYKIPIPPHHSLKQPIE